MDWFEPLKTVLKNHPHFKGKLHLLEKDIEVALRKNSAISSQWGLEEKMVFALAYAAGVSDSLNPYTYFNGCNFDGHSVSTHPQ